MSINTIRHQKHSSSGRRGWSINEGNSTWSSVSLTMGRRRRRQDLRTGLNKVLMVIIHFPLLTWPNCIRPIRCETKSDKIVTWVLTKDGDHFILTNSGRSIKNHQIRWSFHHLDAHQFMQFANIFIRMGDNPAKNFIENVLGLRPRTIIGRFPSSKMDGHGLEHFHFLMRMCFQEYCF